MLAEKMRAVTRTLCDGSLPCTTGGNRKTHETYASAVKKFTKNDGTFQIKNETDQLRTIGKKGARKIL